jgi:mono/diheme cytochrome c family protein
MERTKATTATLCAGLIALAALPASVPSHAADAAAVSRGQYLVRAGDCAACHTAKGGRPFAGGRAMATPFGTIHTTNITPDRETGIGEWSQEDFYRAMHSGIRRDGQHLYPAFPYPWFTKITRSDVMDIKAYLDTVEPVRQQDKPPEI